jgi:xanthine/uracil permease
VLGVILLESATLLQPTARTAIVWSALWAISMGLFPMTQNYSLAVALLVIAGVFNIAFTSVAQTVVQILAPARVRGTIVGLFNTAMLGLRAGAGVTVGVVGAFTGVRLSLELSSLMVLIVAIALLAREARNGAHAEPSLVTDQESV